MACDNGPDMCQLVCYDVQVTEYLGAGVDKVVVDAMDLMAAKAAWATHAANQLMADIGPERLLFDANDNAKVRCLLPGIKGCLKLKSWRAAGNGAGRDNNIQ